jgi:GNAT superfamily N-acetyltransferase
VMDSAVDPASKVGFRELDAGDVAEVAALRDHVLARLRHPDDYVPHDEEDAFLRAHFGRAGVCLGIELDRRLVGFSALTFDIERAHIDVELREAIVARGVPPEETCVLAVTMLHPGFRGMGLHRRAIDLRLDIARRRGRLQAIAIASPSNTPSLCNLLRRGGRVESIIDLADARVRYLVSIAAHRRPRRGAASLPLVPVSEPARLRPLLRQGYVGEEVVFVHGRAHFRLAAAGQGLRG